jgi:hypothetical protein
VPSLRRKFADDAERELVSSITTDRREIKAVSTTAVFFVLWRASASNAPIETANARAMEAGNCIDNRRISWVVATRMLRRFSQIA